MATHAGSEGIVKIGSNTVAEVRSFTITEEARVSDDSSLTDTWDTHLAAGKSWSASVTCWWDETDTNGQVAMTSGTSVTLNLYPEGDTSGDIFYSGTATITNVGVAISRDATTERTFECTGNGALTIAAVS